MLEVVCLFTSCVNKTVRTPRHARLLRSYLCGHVEGMPDAAKILSVYDAVLAQGNAVSREVVHALLASVHRPVSGTL